METRSLSWVLEGDTVLDAYCGSGTTLVAAERNGRSWIGIDVSREAVELARGRVERVAGEKYEIGG